MSTTSAVRRIAMLREMGLTPVWVTRDTPPIEPPLGETQPSDAQTILQRTQKTTSRTTSTQAARSSPVVRSNDAAADAEIDKRRVQIVQMDWSALNAAVAACTACGLHASRTQTVFGVGDVQADWMIVGEAPGADEDRAGEPFVGQAGKLLDAMLLALGLHRQKNVYIANVLKCRPPGNRNPEPAEVVRCAPYLSRQVALVQPKMILAMGRFAVQALLGTEASIASLRGRSHTYEGVPLVVTYHPAYLLRNLPEKAKAWQDLRLAWRTLENGAT